MVGVHKSVVSALSIKTYCNFKGDIKISNCFINTQTADNQILIDVILTKIKNHYVELFIIFV